MKALRTLIEELHSLIDSPSMGVPAHAKEIQTFEKARRLLVVATHQLNDSDYNTEELITIKSFVSGMNHARTMSPNAARGYIAAMWRGGAGGIVRKIPFGSVIERNLKAFLQGGPHG